MYTISIKLCPSNKIFLFLARIIVISHFQNNEAAVADHDVNLLTILNLTGLLAFLLGDKIILVAFASAVEELLTCPSRGIVVVSLECCAARADHL